MQLVLQLNTAQTQPQQQVFPTAAAAAHGLPSYLLLSHSPSPYHTQPGKPLVKPATTRITLPTFVRVACFIYDVGDAAVDAATAAAGSAVMGFGTACVLMQ